MVNKLTHLKEIVEKLKAVNPYKIILFGSLAKANALQTNDIDLLVEPFENLTFQKFQQP